MATLPAQRDSKVWAALGPTNTGKTHLAVERMLAHPSGMIGLPLRLLAREVYDRIVRAKGVSQVALVTGEERIVPGSARYVVATVEAMPMDRPVSFLAVDEVQLCADPDRGHIFTDRILRGRGLAETMFLGSDTMRSMIRTLAPGAHVERRERLSRLSYGGSSRITRLPRRSAIVAFSAVEVYAIAELIRRHRGGAAVVMGALSPRTRNAQVDLYQSGEVDFLVATDAIGMGLNMDVVHVAFAGLSKFDGRTHRPLRSDEIAQIAGRAGRFRTDGTFGETADCPPLDDDSIGRVESHSFDSVDTVMWRTAALDFASPRALLASLDAPPPGPGFSRVRGALDEISFQRLVHDPWIAERARGPRGVARLWDLCQLPDFRKSPQEEHVRLLEGLARHLLESGGVVPSETLARRVAELDRADGDIEQLQNRLSAIRTWTYVANRADWAAEAEHWRAETRAVEDRLSDTLHQRLMQRFVDKRTSALLKGLKREVAMAVDVAVDGTVTVEGHLLGRLVGLRFLPDPDASGLEERAVKTAALQALRPELAKRLNAISEGDSAGFTLTDSGAILWEADEIATLQPRQPVLKPKAQLTGGEMGPEECRKRALDRLDEWLVSMAAKDLEPLFALRDAADGIVRGGGTAAAPEQEAEPAKETATETDSDAPLAAAPETPPAPEPEAGPDPVEAAPASPEETGAAQADIPSEEATPSGEADASPDTPDTPELGSETAQPDTAPAAELAAVEAPEAAAPRAPRKGPKPPKPGPQPLKGLARGMAFRLAEAGGVLDRAGMEADLAALSQDDRKALRAVGVRFGRAGLYLPGLLKPRAARLHAILDWSSRGAEGGLPFLPSPGATSVKLEAAPPAEQLAAAGYRAFGLRAVRLDIVDRIADALFSAAEAAKGPCAFPLAVVSLLGAPVEEAEGVATALGWHKEVNAEGVALWRHRRPRPQRPDGPPNRQRGDRAGPAGDGRNRNRAPAAGASTASGGEHSPRPPRPEGARSGERRPDRFKPGGDRPPQRFGEGRPRGDGRDRGGPPRERVISAAPDRKPNAWADSPFAALAALKVVSPPPPPQLPAGAEGKAKRKRPPRRKGRGGPREGVIEAQVEAGQGIAETHAEAPAAAPAPEPEG